MGTEKPKTNKELINIIEIYVTSLVSKAVLKYYWDIIHSTMKKTKIFTENGLLINGAGQMPRPYGEK